MLVSLAISCRRNQRTKISPLIGTDEVGNGSYFGGLAVVASFVTLTSMISYENSVERF